MMSIMLIFPTSIILIIYLVEILVNLNMEFFRTDFVL